MKKFFIGILIIATLSAYSGTFNMVNYDPRALSLGGATVAFPSIGGAIISNPANAGYFRGKEFTGMFGKYQEFPIYNGLLNYVVEDNGVAAGGLYWEYTGYKLYDNDFNWSENLIGYSIGKKFGWHLSLGMGIKLLFVNSDFDGGKAFGGAIDVGATGDMLNTFYWGVSLHNLYSRLKWDTGRKEKLPFGYSFGISVLNLWDRLSLSLQINGSGGLESAGGGVELWIVKNWFAVRGGSIEKIAEPSRTIPTIGFTIALPSGKNILSLNYAAIYDNEVLGFVQRLSLNVYWF